VCEVEGQKDGGWWWAVEIGVLEEGCAVALLADCADGSDR
jgi:hypothetical protein